jgi:hypothetical protein
MTTACSGGSGLTYTATFNKITFKITISTSATFSLLWNTGVNTLINIAEIIGFVKTADNTGTTTYTGTNIINLNTETYVLVKSDIIKSKFHGVVTSNATDTTILARIPIDQNYGFVVYYGLIDNYPIQANIEGNPTTMTINTTFRSGKAIDFNGANISFKFGLHIQ